MFKLEINTENEAFQGRRRVEIAAILREVARTLQTSPSAIAGRVRDTNGNTVGGWTLTD